MIKQKANGLEASMKALLRKLRGVVGIGLTWGILWAAIGAATGIMIGIVDPSPTLSLSPARVTIS